jgi:NACHT domain
MCLTSGSLEQRPDRNLTPFKVITKGNENSTVNQGTVQSTGTAEQQNGAGSLEATTIGKLSIRSKPTKAANHGPPADLLEDFILDKLAYKSMRDREEEVAEAHRKTFEWIFKQQTGGGRNHQFTTWLATDELGPIYWISGKPGAGKSTLMRLLFGHSSTTSYLKYWADNLPVFKAGFFFWTSGSKEQRSQTGLLRYLLYQLLSENRDIMPKAFPKLWEKLQGMTTKERVLMSLEWDAQELMRSFHSMVSGMVENSKICLFVDGLDEFDGDQNELVHFFQSLGKGVHGDRVKMCLASRPWAVFESSFQSSVPNIKLQELTYQDMYQYVADRLSSDAKTGSCIEQNATSKDALFNEIVQRADGVFLWPRLIIDKALKEFRPSSGIAHLRSIIQSQPTELEDLFEKVIFVDQDTADISETANIFQLITAREVAARFVNDETANSLNVWEIAIALDPEDDAIALSDDEVRQATDDEVQSRCEKTCARIDQRFMGLLGIFPHHHGGNKRATLVETAEEENPSSSSRIIAGHKVTYIHRTVRDWLMESEGVRERLVERSPETFDAHLRLLRSGILALKLPVERPWRRRWLNDWWPQITICMTHARNVQHDPSDLQRPLLNELDRTIGWYWIPKLGDPSDHWAKHMFGSYEIRMKAPPIREPYLCIVSKFGIETYVRKELKDLMLKDSPATHEQDSAEISIDDETEGEEAVSQERDDGEEEEEDEPEKEEDTREGTPLLAYATEYICSRQKSIYPLSSPSFVEYLLKTSSGYTPDPNHVYTDFLTRRPTTLWLALLDHLRRARRRGWISHLDIDPEGTPRWTKIVRLFLEAGADVDAVLLGDRWHPEMSATQILEMLEAEYCAVEISELKKSLIGLREHGEGSAKGKRIVDM